MPIIKLEVGKSYKSRNGQVVKIIKQKSLTFTWPFVGDNKQTYGTYGNWSVYSKLHEFDLIEEIPNV